MEMGPPTLLYSIFLHFLLAHRYNTLLAGRTRCVLGIGRGNKEGKQLAKPLLVMLIKRDYSPHIAFRPMAIIF